MGLKRKIKEFFAEVYRIYRIERRKRNEIIKFKDPRRVEIYSKVQLTQAQKDEIDSLFISNYGKKIPYTWHRHFTATSRRFDAKYFPELLYIPEFEHYMNPYPAYADVFFDKNVLPMIAKAVGIKTPELVLSSTRGALRDADYRFISVEEAGKLLANRGEVFCKPSVDSSSGRNCFIADFVDGEDQITGRSVSEVLKNLGNDFVIQERLRCHDSISAIYAESVNTFRVMTYRWNGGLKHVPSIMRIGRNGSFLDNAHAGGIFIAIDDDGTLHKTAMTEFNVKFSRHPDTDFSFEGYRIECFEKVLDAALRMHQAVPQLGVVNWDITIDRNGEPVLIEANLHAGSIWLFEMAHGKGAFGEDTAQVLRWLRTISKSKNKKKYYYGRMG